MTPDEFVAQVQALHELVIGKYGKPDWIAFSNYGSGSKDPAAVGCMNGYFNKVFPPKRFRAGDEGLAYQEAKALARAKRLLVLNALLRLMEWRQGAYRPVTLTSTKELYMAEVYGLLDWLRDNPDALKVIELAGVSPLWREMLSILGYVERPPVGTTLPVAVPQEEMALSW